MSRYATALLSLLWWSAASPAPIPPTPSPSIGTASGQFIVGEKKFPLTFAYALREDDVESNDSSAPRRFLTLVLSDTTLTKEQVGDGSALSALSHAGGFHGVRFQYDPATKRFYQVTVYYAGLDGDDPPLSISLTGSGVNHQIDHLKIGSAFLTGRARMEKPDEWPSFDKSAPTEMFSYQADFSAPIYERPPVTAILIGKAAQDCPAAAVATTYCIASAHGDLETVRRVSLPSLKREELQRREGEVTTRRVMRMLGPSPETFRAGITRAVFRGDTVTIVSRDPRNSNLQTRIRLVRRGGDWLVAP